MCPLVPGGGAGRRCAGRDRNVVFINIRALECGSSKGVVLSAREEAFGPIRWCPGMTETPLRHSCQASRPPTPPHPGPLPAGEGRDEVSWAIQAAWDATRMRRFDGDEADRDIARPLRTGEPDKTLTSMQKE